MTKIISLLEEGKNSILEQTLEVLRNGGLVVFPSDTVYGLLVDATNEKAVQKLIQFKNRPPGKAISVFVSDRIMLEDCVTVGDRQAKLLDQLLPGPFTIILDSKNKVSFLLESEKGTLGVRLQNYSLVNELVNKFNKPVTATSANLGGRSPHYSVESLLKELPDSKKELIDLVVDAGKLPRNKPSTIVDLTTPDLKILRHGDIEFKNTQSFVTQTPSQTKKTALYILERHLKLSKDQPLVFLLQGDLGAGKTMFVKGAAEYFGIDNIISPTFVVYYEYPIENSDFKNFYHFDLYNIEEEEEFKHLGMDKVLRGQNIVFIEWGEKLGKLYVEIKEKAKVVYIEINYLDEKEREIKVNM